jgi:hypothetical protein
MGANAQTSVPTFTAGEVLTAANMNISARTGIPVFADTTARDAAFGGTGEKTLAEGQFAYIENIAGSAATQYYDGSAWQTLSINPGLVCVKAQTTFTTSSSVTADNIFTSTYANYLVLITWDASTASNLVMRLRVGGVDNSTANSYARQSIEVDNTTVTGFRGTDSSFLLGAGSTTGPSTVALNLFQPAVADETLFQCNNQKQVTNPILFLNYAFHNQATAYDGLNIFPNSGTITGSYAVYGYSKTV